MERGQKEANENLTFGDLLMDMGAGALPKRHPWVDDFKLGLLFTFITL